MGDYGISKCSGLGSIGVAYVLKTRSQSLSFSKTIPLCQHSAELEISLQEEKATNRYCKAQTYLPPLWHN